MGFKAWWDAAKETNTAVSILQRFVPGAVMTTLAGYGAHTWARITHLPSVVQFALTLVVVAAALWIWIAVILLQQYLVPRIDVSLTAHTTPASEVVITVKNKGTDGSFSAKGVVSLLTSSRSPFQLSWQDSSDKEAVINRGDSANLLVASMQDDVRNVSLQMTIWQLLSGAKKEFCLAMWNVQPKEDLPSHLLRVTVRSKGKRGSASGCFAITPKHYAGPLQVLSFSPYEANQFVGLGGEE
jgi:hypothetical protein